MQSFARTHTLEIDLSNPMETFPWYDDGSYHPVSQLSCPYHVAKTYSYYYMYALIVGGVQISALPMGHTCIQVS